MKSLLAHLKWNDARIVLLIITLAGVMLEAVYILKSPAIPLLPPHIDGTWIRRNYQRNLYIHKDLATVGYFRTNFTVSEPASDIRVTITAFRNINIFLDGNPLPQPSVSSWKDQIHIVIPGHRLSRGTHEIGIVVTNFMGPPLFHISSSLEELEEIQSWEASGNGIDWLPALRGDEKLNTDFRAMFPSVADGLILSFPLMFSLFLGTLSLALLRPGFYQTLTSPMKIRISLLVLWMVLCVNDALKLPHLLGFDTIDHLDYIMYVYEKLRLPLASEGLQMFQPPLYYVLSAFLYSVLDFFFPFRTTLLLLKAIPTGCAVLLVEISYRILKELFPDREDLQCIGLIVGGLLPMNLYMCQFYGNEPLTAVLTALMMLISIRSFRRPGGIRMKDTVLLGAVGGLAILTKATPIIMILIVCALVLTVPRTEQHGISARMKILAVFIVTLCIFAGWFYAKNWLIFGKPFVSGWDPLRGIVWWQDPAYRVVSDFFSFGEALRQPVYAAFNGFADAVYSTFWSDGYLSSSSEYWARPQWNYPLLAAGIGLSIIPALLMATGIFMAFCKAGREDWWPFTFMAVSIGAYLAAMLHLYAVLPIYSTAKASYTMGLTPCYAAIVALGADQIIKVKYVREILMSFLVTWGATTYIGFFVL